MLVLCVHLYAGMICNLATCTVSIVVKYESREDGYFSPQPEQETAWICKIAIGWEVGQVYS